MSNKETSETYGTEEKTEERDRANEEAANKLEGSSVTPPEINLPSDNPYKDYRDAANQAAANKLESHAPHGGPPGSGKQLEGKKRVFLNLAKEAFLNRR